MAIILLYDYRNGIGTRGGEFIDINFDLSEFHRKFTGIRQYFGEALIDEVELKDIIKNIEAALKTSKYKHSRSLKLVLKSLKHAQIIGGITNVTYE